MNSIRSINRSLIRGKPQIASNSLTESNIDLRPTFPLHSKDFKDISSMSDADIVGRASPESIGIHQHMSFDHEFYKDGVPEDPKPVHTILKFVIEVVLFLPKYIVYKPVRYIVFVVTYPVRIIIYLLFYRVRIQISQEKNTGEERTAGSGNPKNCPDNSAPDKNSSPPASKEDQGPHHANEDDIKFEVAEKDDDCIKSPQGIVPVHKRTDSSLSSLSLKVDPKERNDALQGIRTSHRFTPPSKTKSHGSSPSRKRPHKKTFIFPRLLFNFDINHPPKMVKKTLVLDLDETLIHSLSRYNSSILTKNKGTSVEVRLNNSGLTTLYHIYKRPHVDEFLSIVRHWYNLVCFTASIKEYADPVINYLEEQVKLRDKTDTISQPALSSPISESEPPVSGDNQVFSHRFYRDSCIFVEGKGYVKNLNVLTGRSDSKSSMSPRLSSSVHRNSMDTPTPTPTPTPSPSPSSRATFGKDRAGTLSRPGSTTSSSSHHIHRGKSFSRARNSRHTDLSKIVIVDNSPISYSHHKDNGVMIEGWINDPGDVELLSLLPLLNGLRFTSDVRTILSLKNGQSAFR